MSALRAYRDDGPLAVLAARSAGAALRARPLVLFVAGAIPLLVVLAAAGDALPSAPAGLAALAVLVVLTGLGLRRVDAGRFAWLVPPLLRALEYGVLIRLTVVADHDALPLCYALLGVLAFHHYDTVYRLRHQKVAPPSWLGVVSGGWDGRLLVVYVLALAGALSTGLLVVAVALAGLFGIESVASWSRFAREEARTVYEDDDVEDA